MRRIPGSIFLLVGLSAAQARAGAPATAAKAPVVDAYEIGTIYGSCPDAPVNVLDVEGWPQLARLDERLDAVQALLTCAVTQIDYQVHWGVVGADGRVLPDVEYATHARELDTVLGVVATLGACDTELECGTKVDTWCKTIDPKCRCTHGGKKTSKIVKVGETCEGTCGDGTSIRVTCRTVTPKK